MNSTNTITEIERAALTLLTSTEFYNAAIRAHIENFCNDPAFDQFLDRDLSYAIENQTILKDETDDRPEWIKLKINAFQMAANQLINQIVFYRRADRPAGDYIQETPVMFVSTSLAAAVVEFHKDILEAQIQYFLERELQLQEGV